MHFESFVGEQYNTYSSYEKVDLLLALHSVFNLMLKSAEKIRNTRNLDIIEEHVLSLELSNLKDDIWKCENEINKIRKTATNAHILEKVEAAQIDKKSHKIIEQEPISDSLVHYLKRLLLSIRINCLQITALRKRKPTPSISEKEKFVLTKTIGVLQRKIIYSYNKLDYMDRWVIPIDFIHRKEIMDEIEDSQIEALKVIPGSRCITVNYLKSEEDGNLDLRKWETKKWLMKRYNLFQAPKHPFLDPNYKFNFQALIEGFNRYSFKKRIEVGLADYNSYKIQLKAFMKWHKNRQKKLTDYEKLVCEYKIAKCQTCLNTWDGKIFQVFVGILRNNFYSSKAISNIWGKINTANLKSYYTEEVDGFLRFEINDNDEESYRKLQDDYENLKDEYTKKYKILSLSFAPGRMCGNAYISPSDPKDPNRSEFIKFLIAKHNIQTVECDALLKSIRELKGYEKRYENIIIKSLCVYKTHHILLTDEEIWDSYNMLPNDYPNKENILKEIKKAKVCLDLEEIIEEKSGKELYNYRAYPDSKELFAYDEPPKPVEFFQEKHPESGDESLGES